MKETEDYNLDHPKKHHCDLPISKQKLRSASNKRTIKKSMLISISLIHTNGYVLSFIDLILVGLFRQKEIGILAVCFNTNPELKITFLNIPSVYLDSAYFEGFYFITCLYD